MYHLVRHFKLECPQIDILKRVRGLLVHICFANFFNLWGHVSGITFVNPSGVLIGHTTAIRIFHSVLNLCRTSALHDPQISKLLGPLGKVKPTKSDIPNTEDDAPDAHLSSLIKPEKLLRPEFDSNFPFVRLNFSYV